MASGKDNNNSIGFLEMIYQAVQSASMVGLFRNDTSPLTNLYVSLHTANPGAPGNQQTSEAAYTGYARVAVARTTGGWTITGETITNAAAITFPASSSGPEAETYVGIGTTTTGNAGVLLWFGQLTAPLTVNSGITPSIALGSLSITES
jgi:hypothetical protein